MSDNTIFVDMLLVEDNPDHVIMTREALAGIKTVRQLHVAEDGEEAIAFLRKTGKHAHVPRPAIILLDLNLPRKNGFQVLDEIKGDTNLRDIPVIVMTTSKNERDIERCYKSHANCYIKKPVDFDMFVEVIKNIERFWLSVVTLPSEERRTV